MEHMLFVTLQSRYMKSDTGHKRKAPHVDFVLIKIQDFVVFLVFFQVHILRGKQRFVIIHAEVFMPGAKKMPVRDETK